MDECTGRGSAEGLISENHVQAKLGEHGYAPVLCARDATEEAEHPTGIMQLRWVRVETAIGFWTGAMQDHGYGLPRRPLPGTSVNKGIKKGRGVVPRPFSFSL